MRINYSRVQHFQRCPRYYYYRYVENLAEKRIPLPLVIGLGVHRGLAALATGAKNPEIQQEVSKPFTDALRRTTWLDAEKEDIVAQQAYATQILLWYQQEYPRESFTWLAPEVEGHVPLGQHEFFFRIDGIVSMKGLPWLFETKTTSQLSMPFFKKFRLDAQISLYIYAADQSLHIRPKGAIINAICKSRLRDRASFQRDLVTRTDGQIDECVQQTIRQATEIEQLTGAPKAEWKMHYNECVRYNRTCEYLELCSGQTIDIADLYITRELDYVDRDEEET